MLYTSVSPLGENIRLNKCIGYFENILDFKPGLPRQCPRPDDDILRQYSSQCINYGRSLSACEPVDPNEPLPYYDYQCREYLAQFTYSGCYANHSADQNFLSSEWRVWTGTVFLDPSHDRVMLLDDRGRVVDYREY